MRSFKKKDKKAGVLAILICAMFICIAFSGCTQQQNVTTEIKNPTTIVRYDIGDAKTLDPADAMILGPLSQSFRSMTHSLHIRETIH